MNNKIAKGAGIIAVAADVILIFYRAAAQPGNQFAPFQLVGGIIGFGIALFLIQRLTRWILKKSNFGGDAEWTALTIAGVIYFAVYAFFSFSS